MHIKFYFTLIKFFFSLLPWKITEIRLYFLQISIIKCKYIYTNLSLRIVNNTKSNNWYNNWFYSKKMKNIQLPAAIHFFFYHLELAFKIKNTRSTWMNHPVLLYWDSFLFIIFFFLLSTNQFPIFHTSHE